MEKHKKYGVIILLITIFIMIILLKDNFNEIMGILFGCDKKWLLLVFFIYFLYLIFDQLSMWLIIKQFRDDISFRFALYLGIIGRFFSGITPLSTGGQPAQMYELHKKGVSISDSTNMEIQAFLVFQIAVILWGSISLILNHTLGLFKSIPLLREMTIIGFTINFLILFLVFLVSFSKNFNRNIIKSIIKILNKLKIVKDVDKQVKKWNKICDEYYMNAKRLWHNKRVLFGCVLSQFASLSLYYSLPFFIAISLGFADKLKIYSTIAASSYVFITGCFIPIPGATGGMEYGFLGFFGNFVKTYQLNALLISWRFITYYLPTILGAIVFNVTTNTKRRKYVRNG